jgi:hypothetical protein
VAGSTSIQNSFVAGELSPSIFGRTDLNKYHSGASTMRNLFVNYRGGASSRAGLAYVGTCKQSGTGLPPRDIPFQFSVTQGYVLEFGDQYMRVKSNGAYVIEATEAITSATQANPAVIGIAAHGYSAGDWIFITGMLGMTNFNGLTWIVNTVPDANHVTLTDLFGNVVSSGLFNAYTSGGTAARIYTVVSPYAAVDIPYLKYTQSADTMTLCCVNQATRFEYPSYELVRNGNTAWVFTADTFQSVIAAPTITSVVANHSTTLSTYYAYGVTAIDKTTGEESVVSNTVSVQNNDISINAGSNVITWTPVPNAVSYNIYGSTPSYSVDIPVGADFGYLGSAVGLSFTDTNIVADFTTVPPLHQNPFARNQVLTVPVLVGGTGITGTITFSFSSATGSGFIAEAVVIGGVLEAVIVVNGGQNYVLGTDTLTLTGTWTTAPSVTYTTGPASGTYPAVAAYYQERRVYASTLNNPDTYFMSQPGAFANFDSATPTVDNDAITGTPWAQQVNGIQFMVPMPGGLVVLTGKGAWQVNGGNSAAITPADQDANPQAYNGCNNIVPPITINYDILYVQSKGSIVRDLAYNFFVNIYTGTDLTVLSNHLFTDHTIVQWAFSEEPYKIVWAVRDDGILLSLTYLKEQDVYAWARHDTNGLVVGVTVVTEPPVDAVYVIVKRYIQGGWRYYSERMDNRSWTTAETCVCSDACLQLPMNTPNAALTPSAIGNTNNITGVNIVYGGSGYTSPTVIVLDPTDSGTGATFSATVVGGVITAITPVTSGQNYAPGSAIVISDPTGSGAIAQALVTNYVTFTASTSVFTSANIGDVIRVDGGNATVTSYVSGTQVVGNVTIPLTETLQNNPNNQPVPAAAGNWTITTPASQVSGLNHLEGQTVCILADGSVVDNQTVVNGTVTLPRAYSAVTVGLPYTCQLQTMYFDPPGQPSTLSTRRKLINSVGIIMEATRGIQTGSNQPDASTQPNGTDVPWTNMVEIKQRGATVDAGMAIPLYTGPFYSNLGGGWQMQGQIAIQQTYPLPMNILSLTAYWVAGDT